MKTKIFFALAILSAAVLLGSFKTSFNSTIPAGTTSFSSIPGSEKYFEEYNVRGAIFIYDPLSNSYYTNDSSYFNNSYTPASTFKIFNSLVALETEVIADENVVFKWDGKMRMNPAWNKDTDLKDAFRNSTVWYYQELARKIGAERMQEYLDKAGYGNRNISGGIDQFWLDGELRISPAQQIDLLKRLYANNLPFSKRNIDIVKKVMISEQTREYTLRAKTGWGMDKDTDRGWYVGYLEKGGQVYFFSTFCESTIPDNDQFAKSRIEITKAILRDMKLL